MRVTSAWVILPVLATVIVAVWVVWKVSNRVPKVAKDKIGFVIALSYDDENVAKKVRDDFVYVVKQLIKDGKTGSYFEFIDVAKHLADDVVDLDAAQKLRLATGAHFMLYGRVLLREVNQVTNHYIDLNGIVAHNVVPDVVRQTLAAEFSELLPRKVLIAKENDLFAFAFTSQWTELVAKYIIAIAASVSGDFHRSVNLYQDVLDKVGAKGNVFPVFAKLSERIPIRLVEIGTARAVIAYERWADARDAAAMDELESTLQTIDDKYDAPQIVTLRAITAFVNHRNVPEALKQLERIPRSMRDATWHLNVAFLAGYGGNLFQSSQHYKKAAMQGVEPRVISLTEDFMSSIVAAENDKPQIHYCLGYFNLKIKGDNLRAVEDFRAFLNTVVGNQFQKERALAVKWVTEISAKAA